MKQLWSLVLLVLPQVALAGWDPGPKTERDYVKGLAALDIGELQAAEQHFREVLRKEPDCGLAMHALGLALLRQNQKQAAYETMEELVAAYPDYVDSWTGLSVTAFAAQQFDRARTAGEKAVELVPGDLEAQVALQEALLREGDLKAARWALDRVDGTLRDADLACLHIQIDLEAGDVDKAASRLGACEEANPALSVPVRNQVAAATGQVAQAGELARRMGLSSTAGVAQALDAYQGGQPQQALAVLDEVLELDPARTDARLMRGRIRHELGDAAGAVQDLEAAIGGEAWVDVAWTGAMSGIVRASHEDDLADRVAEGAWLLLSILTDAGEVDRAEQRLESLRAELGDRPELAAAEAGLRLRQGNASAAYAALRKGLPGGEKLFSWQEAASAVVLQAPEGLTPDIEGAILASAYWNHHYNLGLALMRRGEAGAVEPLMRADLQTLGADLPPESQHQIMALAHQAAVEANELDRATEWSQRIEDVSRLEDIPRVNHARMAFEAGRVEEVLAVLEGIELDNEQAAELAVMIELRALVQLERLDDAATVAQGPHVSAQDRYWVGSQLAVARKDELARVVLAGACGGLDGDAQGKCNELLLAVGGTDD